MLVLQMKFRALTIVSYFDKRYHKIFCAFNVETCDSEMESLLWSYISDAYVEF